MLWFTVQIIIENDERNENGLPLAFSISLARSLCSEYVATWCTSFFFVYAGVSSLFRAETVNHTPLTHANDYLASPHMKCT